MTLSPERVRSYLCGALTGAFTAVSGLAAQRGRNRAAAVTALLGLVCGTLAVVYEERAED